MGRDEIGVNAYLSGMNGLDIIRYVCARYYVICLSGVL